MENTKISVEQHSNEQNATVSYMCFKMELFHELKKITLSRIKKKFKITV